MERKVDQTKLKALYYQYKCDGLFAGTDLECSSFEKFKVWIEASPKLLEAYKLYK